MGMKIHAICDVKNAILKYFSLDMWKFPQIWAFFSCTENFSKTKNPKKCFYSIIAQKNLNGNFWKHVTLINIQVSLRPYDEKKNSTFYLYNMFSKVGIKVFWAIIK